jgi:single-strand DNA-binding protein
MTGSLNKVQLIGRLGKDPELHHSNNLKKSASFTLATSEFWHDKSTNERKERVEWHRIVIFNEKLADIAVAFYKRGNLVYVEGQLRSREWIDKNSQKHITTEVVVPNFYGQITMLTSKGGGQEISEKIEQKEIELNDEIPF